MQCITCVDSIVADQEVTDLNPVGVTKLQKAFAADCANAFCVKSFLGRSSGWSGKPPTFGGAEAPRDRDYLYLKIPFILRYHSMSDQFFQ